MLYVTIEYTLIEKGGLFKHAALNSVYKFISIYNTVKQLASQE